MRGTRRTAKQWAREVRAWKRSGLTADEYASERDFAATTLRWWSSRLKRERDGDSDGLRLVEVELVQERTSSADDSSWEITTAAGHRLHVAGPLSVELAQAVLAVLMAKVRS
jgi:hypothetical protein